MGAPEPPSKNVKREPKTSKDAAVLAQVEDDGDENTLIIKYKPGQKKPTPPGGEGTRVFYETLYKQNNNSLIALSWCLTHGVLPLKDVPSALTKLEKLKAEHKANLDNRPKEKK